MNAPRTSVVTEKGPVRVVTTLPAEAEAPAVMPEQQLSAEQVQAAVIATARMCHEVNRAYCQFNGDDSQPPWETAPDWQRLSAIGGVVALAKNPTITPAQCHALWMAEKLQQGWVLGPKSVEHKTHPCLLPYDQLSREHQIKDVLFGAIARVALGLPR